MACKEGQFDVVKLIQGFSINLNAPCENGMPLFDMYGLRLLGTLKCLLPQASTTVIARPIFEQKSTASLALLMPPNFAIFKSITSAA